MGMVGLSGGTGLRPSIARGEPVRVPEDPIQGAREVTPADRGDKETPPQSL
jgi:hypothetical protein